MSFVTVQWQSHTKCPNCGYCPHCGRSGHTSWPAYPTFPAYPPWPKIWCGTTSGSTVSGSTVQIGFGAQEGANRS